MRSRDTRLVRGSVGQYRFAKQHHDYGEFRSFVAVMRLMKKFFGRTPAAVLPDARESQAASLDAPLRRGERRSLASNV